MVCALFVDFVAVVPWYGVEGGELRLLINTLIDELQGLFMLPSGE